MSIKLQNLSHILEQEFKPTIEPLPILTSKKLADSPFANEVFEVYENLGGVLKKTPCNPQKWHIELENNVVIQLDEQLHFNRYRRATLRSKIYQINWKCFQHAKFQTHCRKMEEECRKSGVAGKFWTYPQAEKEFGQSDEDAGDLNGKGSAAWKKRAFDDFLQDISYKIFNIKLIRLSIWDEIMIQRKLIRLNEILIAPTGETSEALSKLIQRKVASF